MAELIKAHWEPIHAPLLPRSARRGCDYEAFVPDPLTRRSFAFDGSTAADVADSERALERLDQQVGGLADSEALARLLLRAEAVASSRIEGLEIGSRRLLKAGLAAQLGAPATDVTATEILNNIDAMNWAVSTVAQATEVTVQDLKDIHARLLKGTRLEELGGVVRDRQNWIGGSSFNPCSAAFVPPPHERVDALLEDLCEFCNTDSLPAVAQAAIAHAQFETIHPFHDGNGRTGRALVHVILRRRGLATRVLAPVSLVLATWSRDYIDGLTATRLAVAPETPDAVAGLNRWVALFAAALQRGVADADAYQQRVGEIQAKWRARLGDVRADSAANLLIQALPGAPLVTAQGAARLIDRSVQATNTAIAKLVDAEVLHQTTAGRRNRAFESTDLIDAFSDLERQLASPAGDTKVSPPARRTPARRGD